PIRRLPNAPFRREPVLLRSAGRARPSSAARHHSAALRLGPGPQRLGQRVLLGGGPGRLAELEGVSVWVARPSNFITVDKSPGFLWVMEISARIFGVNTSSIQVPQALEGVATVGLTYMMVRRWFGPAAALIAGATVALTPVAALMFRYNNPDALLVLLVTGGAY